MNNKDFNNNPGERITEIIHFLGITSAKFAEEIGVKPQNVYDIRSCKSAISNRIIEKIKNRYPQFNIAWLLTGEGFMLNDLSDSLIDQEVKHGLNSSLLDKMQLLTKLLEKQVEVANNLSEYYHNSCLELYNALLEFNPDHQLIEKYKAIKIDNKNIQEQIRFIKQNK